MEDYFRKYYHSLCYYAMNMVHDRELCNDIVQEVFVKIISQHMRFDSEIHFRRYAYIAMRNQCLNHIQRGSGVQTVDINEESVRLSLLDDGPDTGIVRAEILRMIREAIESLPPRSRVVFKMAYIEHMTSEQIASVLGISVNTVKIMRQRAKTKLKELLKNLYPLLFILLR